MWVATTNMVHSRTDTTTVTPAATAERPRIQPTTARPTPQGSEYVRVAICARPEMSPLSAAAFHTCGSTPTTATPAATYMGRAGTSPRQPSAGSRHTKAAAATVAADAATATAAA